MPRHGVAGAVIDNRFHLVSGMMQSAGALVFLDPTLSTHTAMHDILELQFGARRHRSNQERCRDAFAAPARQAPAPGGDRHQTRSACPGTTKVYTRYNVNSPQGQVMLAKYTQAIEIMRELPQHDQRSWQVVVEYPLDQGISGVPVGSLQEAQDRSDRVAPAGGSRRCGGGVERLPVARLQTPPTRAVSTVVISCPGID